MASIIENGHAYPRQVQQEAPLTDAIRSQSEEILATLFKYAPEPINVQLVLNGRTMFELAAKYGMKDALLKQSLRQRNSISSFSMFKTAISKRTNSEEPRNTAMGILEKR
jgi:hypothetical protein